MAITESEKQPSSSHKNGCAEVGNMAPSKVTEKYKRNKYHEVNYCYGEAKEAKKLVKLKEFEKFISESGEI